MGVAPKNLATDPDYIEVQEELTDVKNEIQKFSIYHPLVADVQAAALHRRKQGVGVPTDGISHLFQSNLSVATIQNNHFSQRARMFKIAAIVALLVSTLAIAGMIFVCSTYPVISLGASFAVGLIPGLSLGLTLIYTAEWRRNKKIAQMWQDTMNALQDQKKMWDSQEFKDWLVKHKLSFTDATAQICSNLYLLKLQTEKERTALGLPNP